MSSALPNGPAPDILRVIGNDVPLHVKTKHELAGPCPFCGTGRDRFIVNTDRQRWWCRQCSGTDHWSDAYEYIQKRDRITFAEAKTRLDGVQLPPAPKPLPRLASDTPPGPVIAAYDYRDESGTLLYQKLRHEPKTFSFQRPDNEGGWIKNLTATRRVLYRLGDLLARPQATVFICEGEKDADTVAGLGLLATADDQGAQTNFKWNRELAELLRGRHVVLLPDKDVVGLARCAAIADALKDIALSCITLELPGDGKDATDWKDAGGTREQLTALVKEARKAQQPPRIFGDEIGADELALIDFPPPRAFVPGILFEGCTLYAAPPKSGKSVSMLGMAVALSTGGRAFGQVKVGKYRVLYMSLEDPRELVQQRLFTMMGHQQLPGLFRLVTQIGPLHELAGQIEAFVRQYPDTGMVVIDTLAHARGIAARARKDIVQEDYQELIGFSHLAHRLHIAIVIITHTAKAQYEDELAQVSGTFGLSGAVDSIMVLNRKRQSPEATLALFSRRLGSDKKLELHWDGDTQSYILDGEMSPEKASRTTSTIIMECLQGASTCLSIRAISELCQISYDVAKQRLFQLLKSGEIVKDDEGKYGLPRKARNLRNFVTTPEENSVTGGYEGGYEAPASEYDDDGF